MIAGVGIDVVALDGFRDQLADSASGFVSGTFTRRELADVESRPAEDKTPHLAARFAAKEAFIKAWSAANAGGPDPLRQVDMKEIEVVSDTYGRPSLRLHGKVLEVATIQGFGDPGKVHLSMSHDGPVATALVVLGHRP